MIFLVPFSEYFSSKLYIAGNSINFSNSVNYLGIYLNQSLTEYNDIMRQVHFCVQQEISCEVIFQSVLYPLRIKCFVLTVLVFMLLNCGVILNRKDLEDYV